VGDIEKAVFFIGKNFQSQPMPGLSKDANLIISGDWQFTNEDAVEMIKEIYQHYKPLFGSDPSDSIQVALMKFPVAASPGMWEGDTRGSTVTILSSDMPFKTQGLQRLHEQLRHEIFHLWMPNGVNLSGGYDWFYEGFALYASLKGGVAMNRIRFEDFLDTLSRAYTIDDFQNPHMSLIEASQKRWSGANTTVYARGMVTAFLCDIALLKGSKGKIDVSTLLKEVFNKYHSQKDKTDGNEAVLTIMAGYPELKPVIEKYIKSNAAIDWTADLAAAGILGEEKNSVTSLKVVEKPDGRQKAMLDKLGYNNWRKN
jgi:predicted metalloprotease with PDZ domain